MRARISHIGSMPLSLPASTSLKLLPFPPHPNPLRPLPTALAQTRTALVTGSRGSVIVPVPSFCSLHLEGSTKSISVEPLSAALSQTGVGAVPPKPNTTEEAPPVKVRLQVENSGLKTQRAQWGLTRALLANAVHGVTEGHSLVLRLVGVGYRAAVEADPFPAPDAIEQAILQVSGGSAPSSSSSSTSTPATAATSISGSNWLNRDQVELYRQLVASEDGGSQAGSGKDTKKVPQRLNLRLGYSHPIVMPVPRGIECATPAPNRIVLRGNDKAAVGLFASQIRRWRRPEPYKGKGIFVGDETIRLKTAKNK
ncbi:54S ribosomal protein L6 mitochondrial [Tilletia horrida]|nr:54S ribosomal protein L6 mitochondrial [Tilletia horrida]